MAYNSSNILIHLVFSTKERRALIAPEIAPDLHAYLGGIIRGTKGVALIINGTADHVHLLLRIPPINSCSEIVRTLKANSSKWIHERWPERRLFAWQSGYGAFSVSESNVDAVAAYISRQAEHHAKRSFQEELTALLKKNHIAYDERYIWA